MNLHLYNTYKRQCIEFVPLEDKIVRMYNCGPTVHNYAHIGNFRAYIFADLLRRWLEVNGYIVRQVMNITDVDDKTIRRSNEEQLSLKAFTRTYIEAFFADLDRMNIRRAELYPRATHHINDMVDLIQRLLDRGFAYRTEDGSIYFRVSSFRDYGNLSGKRLKDLRIGERVRSDEYETKDDVRDFALWKGWDVNDGAVYWETPLGKGRPGWHIECSAMSMKYLGDYFDIHTGGVDNIFPHHENEIAQSVCGVGSKFVNFWLHCEYLIVDGRKMSKSLGNFYTLRDLIDQGHKPRAIRYVLATTHYRSQLNFSFESLSAAKNALQRLDEFRASWADYPEVEENDEVRGAVERAKMAFTEAMNDDLNVSRAMAAVFGIVREINALAKENKVSQRDIPRLQQVWREWDDALGILTPFPDEISDSDLDVERIERLITIRNDARKAKNWKEADRIRKVLLTEGIELKDTAEKTTWKRK